MQHPPAFREGRERAFSTEGLNMNGNFAHNLAAVLAMFGAGLEGMALELA